jgi:putative transposon-encoded protein
MVKIRKASVRKGKKDDKDFSSKKSNKRVELNSKELKVNLEQLQRDVKKAYSSMMKVIPESIKDAEIKRFGNASHIILPKEYSGKKATVIIKKK